MLSTNMAAAWKGSASVYQITEVNAEEGSAQSSAGTGIPSPRLQEWEKSEGKGSTFRKHTLWANPGFNKILPDARFG